MIRSTASSCGLGDVRSPIPPPPSSAAAEAGITTGGAISKGVVGVKGEPAAAGLTAPMVDPAEIDVAAGVGERNDAKLSVAVLEGTAVEEVGCVAWILPTGFSKTEKSTDAHASISVGVVAATTGGRLVVFVVDPLDAGGSIVAGGTTAGAANAPAMSGNAVIAGFASEGDDTISPQSSSSSTFSSCMANGFAIDSDPVVVTGSERGFTGAGPVPGVSF